MLENKDHNKDPQERKFVSNQLEEVLKLETRPRVI